MDDDFRRFKKYKEDFPNAAPLSHPGIVLPSFAVHRCWIRRKDRSYSSWIMEIGSQLDFFSTNLISLSKITIHIIGNLSEFIFPLNISNIC